MAPPRPAGAAPPARPSGHAQRHGGECVVVKGVASFLHERGGHGARRTLDQRFLEAQGRTTSFTASVMRWWKGERLQAGSVLPASPVSRNTWQRQPPKSFSFRCRTGRARQPVQAAVFAKQRGLMPQPGERAFAHRLELQPRNDAAIPGRAYGHAIGGQWSGGWRPSHSCAGLGRPSSGRHHSTASCACPTARHC